MGRRALLCLAVVCGLAAFAASAQAATRTAVTFTDTTVSTGTPERMWISDDQMLHVRGQTQTTAVTGDLTGSFQLDVNLNLDLTTGSGVLFGDFTLTTTSGTWTGAFNGTISPDGVSGRFVGQGDDGSKITGTFTSIGPDSFLNEAVILAPHG
jgi:hypothetical protein